MGRKHWKTIYKELEKPIYLYSDDGNSMAIIGKYSRSEAFYKIKEGLKEEFGATQEEYKNLKSINQLDVALLRRPIPDEDEMDSNFVVEKISATLPSDTEVWIYFIEI